MCFSKGKNKVFCFRSKFNNDNKIKNTTKSIKLILCGSPYVGKTSITSRFINSQFDLLHYPTLAAAYKQKTINIKNQEIQLNIWDTAGDQKFKSIMSIYYRDAKIAFLVYDITNKQTFNGINYWLKELSQKVNTQGILIVLVGNKSDLTNKRQVSMQQGKQKANNNNALFFETSAKEGTGIIDLFKKSAQKFIFHK